MDAVRCGRGGAIVVRGVRGIGKSALLDYTAAACTGLRLVRINGIPAERHLAYAVLHRTCAPLLDRIDSLPAPQADALRVALGLAAGPAPNPMLVASATHGLLTSEPTVCLVDDAQWLDFLSTRALAFAARRLDTEAALLVLAGRVDNFAGCVDDFAGRADDFVGRGGAFAGRVGDFAGRVGDDEFGDLPELRLHGLPDGSARELLASVLPGPLDQRVREQLLAEARGNPSALLHPPSSRGYAHLPGDYHDHPHREPAELETAFRERIRKLPAGARGILVLAAAEPTGDPIAVRAAARNLGLPPRAAALTADAGLLEVDATVRFGHPLARSAAYGSASRRERQAAHRALAEVIDPITDPDRRAWHRARAAHGTDDQLADDLVRWARRAQVRGGLPAAAAFLERAATLTTDPAKRVERTLAAAEAMIPAGDFAAARQLLTRVRPGPLDERQAARQDLLRARLEYASRTGDGVTSLIRAAQRMERLDAGAARAAYLDAFGAAHAAGAPQADSPIRAAARTVLRSARLRSGTRPTDRLLVGLATLYDSGPVQAMPALREALAAWSGESFEAVLRFGGPAVAAAMHSWDDQALIRTVGRVIHLARQAGALGDLLSALELRVPVELLRGRLAKAAALADEFGKISYAIGVESAAPQACLAAFRGASFRGVAFRGVAEGAFFGAGPDGGFRHGLTSGTVDDPGSRLGTATVQWARAVQANGHGQYEEANAAARIAVDTVEFGPGQWALAELIESAARTGAAGDLREALDRLCDLAQAAGTDWALGIAARTRGVAPTGSDPESCFREALDRLARTSLRTESARTHLQYGEWLRRQGRRVDARDQLRTAVDMFSAAGLDGFTDRANRELRATGESVRPRRNGPDNSLTAQESVIARLARAGMSNLEIGVELFISARTVEWHLRKVYVKLGISSRRELRRVLTDSRALPDGAGLSPVSSGDGAG
ncbi:DNA-binding CsgD family transcriptional regulator [Hamadaea flava]|nr:DNA-binding CsgD family transcriptional regulator [Hamadaea flava]